MKQAETRYPMAYTTQSHTSTLSNIWTGISDFFGNVALAIIVSSSADARLRQIDRLNTKTDEELAGMGLKRQDITAYVFRDLMHI